MKEKSGKMSADRKFMLLLILVILVLEAVGGGIVYSAYAKEQRCSLRTQGTLLEWVRWTRKNTTNYSPVVEYRVGNETYTEILNVKADKRPFKEGDLVTVGYNPLNPHEFYLEGYDLEILRSFGSSFMILGAAAVIVNLICAALNRVDMEERRRIRCKEFVIAFFFLAAFYWMVISFSGIMMAVFVTILIAPFVLYVKYKNRRKQKNDSAP